MRTMVLEYESQYQHHGACGLFEVLKTIYFPSGWQVLGNTSTVSIGKIHLLRVNPFLCGTIIDFLKVFSNYYIQQNYMD